MRHTICLFLLLFGLLGQGKAQSHLIIGHPKRSQVISMKVGDAISLNLQDSKVRGRITRLSDSTLWVITETHVAGSHEIDLRSYRQEIPLSEVQSIDKAPSPHWRRFQRVYSGITMAGGSMVILGSSFNALATDQPPKLTTLAITGLVLSSGLLMRMLGRRTYRREKGWRWWIVPAGAPRPIQGLTSGENDP
jgi:hypothetical protein